MNSGVEKGKIIVSALSKISSANVRSLQTSSNEESTTESTAYHITGRKLGYYSVATFEALTHKYLFSSVKKPNLGREA